MRIAKLIGRLLLVFVILVAGYQVLLTAIGVIGAFSVAGSDPETWGRLTGQLLTLALCIWAFRRLATKREATSEGPAPEN
jgi:hypothetical protein